MRDRIGAVLLFAVAALPMASCESPPERVVIGVALTQSHHPAVRLAVDEINADGGIDGVPLEIAGLDWQVVSEYEPSEIMGWVERFDTNPALVAIVGHSDSKSTLAAAPLYNARGIPNLVTIASHPAITRIGEWTFRMCVNDDVQGQTLARYAVEDWGRREIALFYVNDDYGRGLAEVFRTGAEQLGAEILASTPHRNILEPRDEALIRSVIGRLSARERPPLVVLFQRIQAARFTLDAMRASGVEFDVLGGDSLAHSDMLRLPAYEGVRTAQFFHPGPSPDTPRALAAMTGDSGKPVDYALPFAYDAIYLLRDAILAEGPSRAGVRRFLEELGQSGRRIDGLSGRFRFTADREVIRDLYIVEARDGRHRLLDTVPSEPRPSR